MTDGSGDAWIVNICGEVSWPCIPSDWSDPFSHGIAHQYIQGDPRNPTTGLVPGSPMCQGQVTDPATGATVCSSQCIMAAHSFPDYELAVPGNVNGGISVSHAGTPPDANAPFNCPFDGVTGCNGARTVKFLFTCDSSNKNAGQISGLSLNETSTCQYVFTGKTYAACPTKGNPFRNNADQSGPQFGFTVLGCALTLFVQFTYSFGDQRGWWEPIKQRLPAIPGMSFLGLGGKGIYSGGYRPTPVPSSSASPYGSTSM